MGGEGTVLLLDQRPDVEVQPDDYDVAEDVHPPDAVEPCRVFEGDAFGDLHHPEDYDEVGATFVSVPRARDGRGDEEDKHLRVHDGGVLVVMWEGEVEDERTGWLGCARAGTERKDGGLRMRGRIGWGDG